MNTRNGKDIINIGSTWIYKEDLVAAFAVVIIFLIGALMVQVGKRMEAEVEVQRQAEMLQIANDKLVNQEVTK
jgi:hypothetical protein